MVSASTGLDLVDARGVVSGKKVLVPTRIKLYCDTMALPQIDLSQNEKLIPVTLLTGFLGSGKTTILSRLIRQPGLENTAVVINEFGEVGLDHLLMDVREENIVTLESGCICCTMRGDVVDSLRDLWNKSENGEIPEFNRVLIETTGLADPAPILHTLMTEGTLMDRFRMDGVVTTVDCATGNASLDNHPESVKQLALADKIVLTKTDLVSHEERKKLEERIRGINVGALIRHAVKGELDPEELFHAGLFDPETKKIDVERWLHEEAYSHQDHHHSHGTCEIDHEHHDGCHTHHDVNRHDDHIRSFAIIREEPLSGMAMGLLLMFLESIQNASILRMKGIVNLKESPDKPLVIHGVQHIFHQPMLLDSWPDEDRRTRIVFITNNIERQSIEEMFDKLLTSSKNVPEGV